MKGNYLKLTLAIVSALCLTAGAVAANYIWTGQGDPDHDWDTADNWSTFDIPLLDWPSVPTDNALFPWKASGAWPCNLIGESIGQMTIKGSVAFDSAAVPPETVTLGLTKLSITPTSGDVVVTVSGSTQITVP